jgi:hypothetical protein
VIGIIINKFKDSAKKWVEPLNVVFMVIAVILFDAKIASV